MRLVIDLLFKLVVFLFSELRLDSLPCHDRIRELFGRFIVLVLCPAIFFANDCLEDKGRRFARPCG